MDIPVRLGKYRIIKKLGQGASGCVLKAEQDVIHRVVALKILFTNLVQAKPNIIRRFKREARLASSLVHPNIVPIFDISESNGMHYYTMQYVEGIPMTQFVKKRDTPLEKFLSIFMQFCDAVALAHRIDIIHRDLKPHNVIITPDLTPIILDFGIAKSLIDDEQMTQMGHILGSAHYMAPEQAKSARVGTFTDVFAIGVMMYELFTGERPFKGNNVKELIVARLQYGENSEVHRPEYMRKINPEVPEALDRIVFKCLEPSPEKRYSTGGELVEDLQKFCRGMRVYQLITDLSKSQKKSRRLVNRKTSYKYPIVFSLFLLFIGLTLVAWVYWGEGHIPFLDEHLQILRELKDIKVQTLLEKIGM